MNQHGPNGVGIGFRPELAVDLLADRRQVDFVEVVAEACQQGPARREAAALREMWPVVLHGVKLSLGSAEGIDLLRARRFADLARELRVPCVTEHVAFVRGGGRDIGHLTPLPWTVDAARVVAANVGRLRRLLPDIPLLLENIAWTFRYPEDAMAEGDFYAEVVERTGCDLLLDVGNLYANAVNAGRDPGRVLEEMPLDRVRMLHVAGGVFEHGFYFDTHAHAIPEAVFDLVARTLELVGPVPIVLERDAHFPGFDVSGELARLRLQGGSGPPRAVDMRPTETSPTVPDLTDLQAGVARLLTSREAPSPEDVERYGETAIARTRGVLQRKRIDDALPLLPALARRRDRVQAIAESCIERVPAPEKRVAFSDALRIAEAAAAVEDLRGPARADALPLRARFVLAGRGVRPRVAPFVGCEPSPEGGTIWVAKGVGADAGVRTWRKL